MFWLTKHGLDGDASLSESPTASSHTRILLNRVWWMVCSVDQAGGPMKPPSTNAHTHTHTTHTNSIHTSQICTHTQPLRQHTHHPLWRLHTAARWKMAKRIPIILQTDDLGCGRPDHFSSWGLEPCCCQMLTVDSSCSFPSPHPTCFKGTFTVHSLFIAPCLLSLSYFVKEFCSYYGMTEKLRWSNRLIL